MRHTWKIGMLVVLAIAFLLHPKVAKAIIIIDALNCPGTWEADPSTGINTCTLTGDVDEPLMFGIGDTVLNCDGRAVIVNEGGPGAIYAIGVNGVGIKNCHVSNNSGGGIRLDYVLPSVAIPQFTIEGNTFGAHSEIPIFVTNSSGGKIVNNTVSENLEAMGVALAVMNSDDNIIRGNTILGGYTHGIFIDAGSDHNQVLSNNVSSMTSVGAEVRNGVGNIIDGNTLKDNTHYGLLLSSEAFNNVVTNNIMCGNGLADYFTYEGATLDPVVEHVGNACDTKIDNAGTGLLCEYPCLAISTMDQIKQDCLNGEISEGECIYYMRLNGDIIFSIYDGIALDRVRVDRAEIAKFRSKDTKTFEAAMSGISNTARSEESSFLIDMINNDISIRVEIEECSVGCAEGWVECADGFCVPNAAYCGTDYVHCEPGEYVCGPSLGYFCADSPACEPPAAAEAWVECPGGYFAPADVYCTDIVQCGPGEYACGPLIGYFCADSPNCEPPAGTEPAEWVECPGGFFAPDPVYCTGIVQCEPGEYACGPMIGYFCADSPACEQPSMPEWVECPGGYFVPDLAYCIDIVQCEPGEYVCGPTLGYFCSDSPTCGPPAAIEWIECPGGYFAPDILYICTDTQCDPGEYVCGIPSHYFCGDSSACEDPYLCLSASINTPRFELDDAEESFVKESVEALVKARDRQSADLSIDKESKQAFLHSDARDETGAVISVSDITMQGVYGSYVGSDVEGLYELTGEAFKAVIDASDHTKTASLSLDPVLIDLSMDVDTFDDVGNVLSSSELIFDESLYSSGGVYGGKQNPLTTAGAAAKATIDAYGDVKVATMSVDMDVLNIDAAIDSALTAMSIGENYIESDLLSAMVKVPLDRIEIDADVDSTSISMDTSYRFTSKQTSGVDKPVEIDQSLLTSTITVEELDQILNNFLDNKTLVDAYHVIADPDAQVDYIIVTIDGVDYPVEGDTVDEVLEAIDVLLLDSDGDGVPNADDQCPEVAGTVFAGCPHADENHVFIRRRPYFWNKENLEGVEVRAFDREDPDFAAAYCDGGIPCRPKKRLFDDIYEGENGVTIGQIGTCVTASDGRCTIGDDHPGKFLVIAKYTEDGQTAYSGKMKNFFWDPWSDFLNEAVNDPDVDTLSTPRETIIKNLAFMKRGTRLFPAAWIWALGSQLDVYHPDYVVWENEQELYPFVYSTDNDWEVDVCMNAPEGYEVVGILDENENVVSADSCMHAFVAGEEKVFLFQLIDLQSPEPEMSFSLTAVHDGNITEKDVKIGGVRKWTEKRVERAMHRRARMLSLKHKWIEQSKMLNKRAGKIRRMHRGRRR